MSRTLTAMSDSTVTSGQQQWSGPGQTSQPFRGPYISVITNRTTNLVIRGAMLFTVGVFLALVLNLLQVQRNVTLFPPDVISSIFSSAWWVPPCCGTASAMIGLLYPCIDSRLGEPHKFKREWSSVMRCVAVFVGINHASAKVDFANNVQLSLTLAALSIGLWWTFDRSRSGFGLGISIAVLATLATQLLVYNGVFHLVLSRLRPVVGPSMDPLQFAYQPGIGVDEAVIFLLHRALSHLEKPGSSVRIMFFDFSSAFNTIQPALLRDKLEHIGVANHLTSWILDYLTGRPQYVRTQDCVSDLVVCSTGAPQGTVLALFLFTLYTADF
ncbi:insulin-induced gene 2 protein isoform X1 [Epinephelus moara]|uniref:insulin-induced gene 2 protein isoform X1 n=1 Tax=Epinephelus moara TaxID=300413 RepID=UPI00214E5104|nr:insulin-induced gene 2 protein isoform X1 [Epinephelus moara]XP_049904318.1 insulin-induced gene 2 protein isoform X1 [Epinephelus moara]